MRCLTPQVAWHNKDPVLSIDFDPTSTTIIKKILPVVLPDTEGKLASETEDQGKNKACENGDNEEHTDKMDVNEIGTEAIELDGEVKPAVIQNEVLSSFFYRFATGGADSHLLVWHLSKPDSTRPDLVCVADLTRHLKAVNVVRFSSNGQFIASADDDAYICVWKCETKTATDENWMIEKVLRRHLEDISDICWSQDCNYLVSGSVDNSAVLWDVKKGTALQIWSEHNGLVQGVAYDPMGQFVVSICTDRTLRMFNPKSGKVISRALKYPRDWLDEEIEPEHEENISDETEKPAKASLASAALANRIFHDDTLRTFCRRLQFSPRGELLLIPGAILPPSYENVDPASPAKKKAKAIVHAAVIFCRNSFTNPCSIIPCGTSFAIACRFCPVYFQRNRDKVPYGSELVNSTKKSERLISCVGKLKPGIPEDSVLMNMPYRMVFAIATNDSVIIGDTESAEPLAVVGNIHCTRLSDITWSADGRIILVSSTDGFCSFITFDENELGIPYPMENIPELSLNCFPVEAKIVPVKDAEAKTKIPKEDKETKTKKKLSKEEREAKKKAKEEKETNKISKQDNDIKNQTESPIVKKKKTSKAKETPVVTKENKEPSSTDAGKSLEELQNQNVEVDENKRESALATPPPREISELSEMVTPTTEIKDSLAKIKVTPQRNTLDKWIQKTPKTTERQLKKEKLQAEADAKLQKKLEATLPISLEELTKLKEAPIIVDLDEPYDIENACLSTIPGLGDAECNKPIITIIDEEPLKLKPALSDDNSHNMTEEKSVPEKRIAISPITSKPVKQPRRVQLITLDSPTNKK